MPVLLKPLANTDLVVVETGTDEVLGRFSVAVRGRRRDLPFPPQTLAQLLICSANVLLQSVSAVFLVQRKISPAAGTTNMSFSFVLGLRPIWRRTSCQEKQECDTDDVDSTEHSCIT